MNISRRTAIGMTIAAATALVLAGCSSAGSSGGDSSSSSSSGSGSGTSSFTLGLVQGSDFVHAMPARVAEQQGFFKDQNLDVKIVGFTSGSDLIKAIAGGSVNVAAATGLDAVAAPARGVNVKAFYGVEGASPMTLIVPTKSSISAFSDLKGKKVGISAVGSLTDYVVRAAVTKSGGSISDVKEVALGAPAPTMAALGRGDIDALVLPTNFGFILESSGKGKIAQPASAVLGSDDQFGVLLAPSDYIAGNTPTLKRLAAAYTKALEWMKANKAGTVKLAQSALGMSAPIAGKTYDALMPNFTPDGRLNASGLAAYAKALPSLKIATSSPKASDYMTTAITG